MNTLRELRLLPVLAPDQDDSRFYPYVPVSPLTFNRLLDVCEAAEDVVLWLTQKRNPGEHVDLQRLVDAIAELDFDA